MIQKTITITEKHEKYIKSSYLNLSRFVQDKLDERMEGGDMTGEEVDKRLREMTDDDPKARVKKMEKEFIEKGDR